MSDTISIGFVDAPEPKKKRAPRAKKVPPDSAEAVADILFGQAAPQIEEDTSPIEWDGSLPPSPKEWMANHQWVLVTSIEDLRKWWEIVKADTANHVPNIQDILEGTGAVHPKVGFDLETTGLDNRVVLGHCKTNIVGVCLSFYKPGGEGYRTVNSPDYVDISKVTLKQCVGLYIPIAHKRWPYNLDLHAVVQVLDEIFRTAIVVTQNGKFDFYTLKASGDLVSREVPHYHFVETVFERKTIPLPSYPMFEDTQALMFVIDCDRATRGGMGLKQLSMEFLGQEMIEYEEITSTGVKKKGSRKLILHKFDAVAPFKALHYAAADAICTLQLSDVFGFIKQRNPFIHQLDTNIVGFQGWCEEQRPLIDRDFLLDQDRFLDLKCEHVLSQIHNIVGFPVNPDSTKVLGQTLFETMQLPNKGKTPPSKMFPGGQWSTAKEAMEELAREHPQHAIFKLIVSYRELRSATSKTLFDNTEPLDHSAKLGYSATRTPSGRFACSGGEYVKDGGSGVNVQAIKALYAAKYTTVRAIDTLALQGVDGLSSCSIFDPALKVWLDQHVRVVKTVDYPDRDAIIKELKLTGITDDEVKAKAKVAIAEQIAAYTAEGLSVLKEGIKNSSLRSNPTVSGNHLKLTPDAWVCMLESCPECLSGIPCSHSEIPYDVNETINIRRAFIAPPGWTFFSIDYGALELRMVANMANEQLWIDGFIGGKDLHGSMAEACFKDKFLNADPETRSYLRSMAKTITFGNLYGGSSRTIQQNLSEPITIEEAKDLYANWIGAIPNYKKWVDQQKAYVKSYHCVVTMFHRRRSVARDMMSGEPAKIAYAERTGLNHPSQGTAADILRIALNRIQSWILSNNLQDYVKIHFHVHDEVDISCKDECVPYIIPNIVRIMKVHDIITQRLKWPVPLECDVEYGRSWDVKHNFGKKDKCWSGIESLKSLDQGYFKKLFNVIVDGTEFDVADYREQVLSAIYTHWDSIGYQDPYQPFAERKQALVRAFIAHANSSPEWPSLEQLSQSL